MAEAEAFAAGRKLRVTKVPFSANPKSLINGDTRGFVKILCDPATGVVLGGAIVGRNAAELISVIAVAVTNHLKVVDIVDSLLVHPALAESLADAALPDRDARARDRRGRVRREPPRGGAARARRHGGRRRLLHAVLRPRRQGGEPRRARATHASFELVEADLRTAEIEPLLDGVDAVFHQAAQAGVRLSWSRRLRRLRRATTCSRRSGCSKPCSARRPSARVVYASSSSVYGNQARYPTVETDLPKPFTPVRRHEARGRAPVRAVRGELGRAHRVAAVLHGVRPAAAARHVDPPAVRGRGRRLDVPALRRRHARSASSRTSTTSSRGNLAAAERRRRARAPYVNLAGGGEITLERPDRARRRARGRAGRGRRPARRKPATAFRNGGAIDRARERARLGAQVSLRDGLAAQLAWHRRSA